LVSCPDSSVADIEIGQQLGVILAGRLDHLADEILVGRVDHPHDDEGVALRQCRLVEPRGPLADDDQPDAEFAPFLGADRAILPPTATDDAPALTLPPGT
jgi:hypothetical protein